MCLYSNSHSIDAMSGRNDSISFLLNHEWPNSRNLGLPQAAIPKLRCTKLYIQAPPRASSHSSQVYRPFLPLPQARSFFRRTSYSFPFGKFRVSRFLLHLFSNGSSRYCARIFKTLKTGFGSFGNTRSTLHLALIQAV